MQKQEQIDNLALDLLEQQMGEEQELSAEEQRALDESYAELQSLRTVLRREQRPVDVEARLAAFHQAHEESSAAQVSTPPLDDFSSRPGDSRRSRRLVVFSSTVLAIAAVALAIFVLRPTVTQEPANAPLPPGTVFVAQQASGVTISNNREQPVAVKGETNDVTITAEMLRYLDRHTTDRVVSVPYGNSATIDLPDGSTAYVRAGSTINFYTHPINGRRLVKLDGQAYFCVHHDARHPFVVTDADGRTQITDVGTEFNVDTRAEQGITVTLIEGAVDITPNSQRASSRLTPGQQALVAKEAITTREVDTTPFTNWRDGFFYYDNVTLGDILQDIGKNYNLTVHFHNPDAMHYRTHFVVDRTQGIAPVLEMLNRMGKVHARLSGSTIEVE